MTSLRHELHALADDLRTESRQWARCSGFAQRLEAILARHPEPADAALAAFTSDGPRVAAIVEFSAVFDPGSEVTHPTIWQYARTADHRLWERQRGGEWVRIAGPGEGHIE